MRNVLWLSNETPDPHGQGGQRRQFFQIRELVRAGTAVTVCSLQGHQNDCALRQHADVIRTRAHWRGRIALPQHGRLIRRLSAGEWAAVVVAHTESWPTYSRLVRNTSTPSWVDLHNVLGKDVGGHQTAWASVERDICSSASTVSVCSELEATRLLRQQPSITARLTVLPHGIDPHEWRTNRAPAKDPLIKLFGNWAWDPNRRGLEWFLTRVWPSFQETGARCEIAGSGAVIPPDVRRTVTFVGRVPSVDTWARDAWAVAVPVVGGVGAPVKYLEAIATRAPVLSTPDGAPTARHAAALVSPDPQLWMSTLDTLLNNGSPPPDTDVDLSEFSWAAATLPLMTWLGVR